MLCLCCVATFTFWQDITFEERDLFVPIQYDNLPRDAIVTGTALKGLEITIRGKKAITDAFLKEKRVYSIDLSQEIPGIVTLPIDIDRLQIPKGVSLLNISPTDVILRIESKTEKVLPIAVALMGKPAAGYNVGQITIDPPEIKLTGAEKIITSLDQVHTKPIKVDGMSESFKKEISVDLPENIKVLNTNRLVTVAITIEAQVVVKKYENIPVNGRNTMYPYDIQPSTIDVTVKGPELALADLALENSLQAYVDLTDLAPGVYARRAKINLPIGLTLVDATPGVFTVTINP